MTEAKPATQTQPTTTQSMTTKVTNTPKPKNLKPFLKKWKRGNSVQQHICCNLESHLLRYIIGFHFFVLYTCTILLNIHYVHSQFFNIMPFILFVFQEGEKRKRCCPVCHQLRKATDKTLKGEIHHVLGRSNKIWCPYADERCILDEFQKDQKERTKASWQRANAKKEKKAAKM